MPPTDTALRAAKLGAKPRNLADEHGLFVRVNARLRARYDGPNETRRSGGSTRS
jgi:hypothetical protein